MSKPLVRAWLVLVAVPATAAFAQQTFTDLPTLTAFTDTYYLHPRPDLVPAAIAALSSTGALRNRSAVPPVVAFFSEVFAANPDRLPEWRALIERGDAETKTVLRRALALSTSGGVLRLEGHSAELNDMYWGAFFASGNRAYLARLVAQVRHFDERDDLNLFLAGASAMWSLASNAQTHPRVRSALTLMQRTADPRTSQLIADLLAQGPGGVRQATVTILNAQRSAGKWR